MSPVCHGLLTSAKKQNWQGRLDMKQLKQIFKVVVKAVAVVVILIVALNLYTLWSIRPITSISAYEKVLNKRWHTRLVKHFPKTIPPKAEKQIFFYRPGYIQGGSTIELRMRMPSEFIEREIIEGRKKAKLILRGDQESVGNDDPVSMICKSQFMTFPKEEFQSENQLALLPGDFEILLLSSRPYETDPISWNHGDCSGISVSRKRNEVIYWAEDW